MGPPHRPQWLVRASRFADDRQSVRPLAVLAQILSRRSVPASARGQTETARKAPGRARARPLTIILEQCLVAERISIIVATYNRPDALDAVLRVAGAPERSRISKCWSPMTARRNRPKSWSNHGGRGSMAACTTSGMPDDGFRLAEIRNRAILAASGDYCIFLDGDCIARTRFRRRASRAGQARLVRDRQPAAVVASAFGANPERKARAGKLELCRLVAGAARQRDQTACAASRAAARTAAPIAHARLAWRARLQSRHLALGPHRRRWL